MRILMLFGVICIVLGAIVAGGIAFVNSLSDTTNRGRNPLAIFGAATALGLAFIYLGAHHD